MRTIFITLIAVSLFAACETAEKEMVSTNGFRYILHEDKAGAVAEPEQAIFYDMAVYAKNDSVLFSTYQEGERQIAIMPDSATIREAGGQKSALVDAFHLLSAGDSATIFEIFDQPAAVPQGFALGDTIRYVIDVKRITSGDSINQVREQRMAEMQAKLQVYRGRGEAVADTVATELANYKRGAARAGYTTTESGLKYKVLDPGTGPQPQQGKPVLVSYYGVLVSDGEMFDNSFRTGRPFDFPLGLGQVIRGWDEGIALLNEGSRAILAVPSDLAYGDNPRPGGIIGPGAELMFYVQVEQVAQ